MTRKQNRIGAAILSGPSAGSPGSSHRLGTILFGILALLLVLDSGAFAQVCAFGNGGGSGSGSGGATLKTITLDGTDPDWGNVLSNPIQTTNDGEFRSPCGLSAVLDLDCSIGGYRNISGRDLAKFSWTYDSTNIYLYLRRYGSTSNQQTFLFYADSNQNQRMNNGEKVLKVTFSGTNRTLDSTLWTYTVAGAPYGDASGDYMANPTTGFADGYTPWGTLSGSVSIDSNKTWVWADGTGFEARIPWSNLGVAAGTAVYFHVSSINGSGSNVPAGIDDNLGGADGKIGAFAFRLVSVTPDNSVSVTPGNPTVHDFTHTISNTGTLPDRYELTASSSLGFRVDFYDGATLMATDFNGDADFLDPSDYVNPAYDSNADGRPNTPLLGVNPGGTFSLTVRVTAPVGVENVQDTTIVSAFSQNQTDLCASARDTLAIGALVLAPTPQAKSVVASQTVDYGLTLSNFSLADVFDFRIQSTGGWQVQIYTDPNGDGDPADGVLVATDANGNGIFTDSGDSIAGGYDTNANGRPDFGSIANGGSVKLVVRLTAPSGATVGTIDTSTVLAQGAAHGASATAQLTSTVRLRLTFTPSYTVAASTNKYSGQGKEVYYGHTLINSWPTSDTVTLSSTSNPTGWTIRYFTDPDGDGNPNDGTQITGSFSLAGNGGTLKIVVDVVIPTGLTLPLTHTAVVTATGAGSAPTVTDEVRVSYLSVFADSNRTISKRVYALCQTIYATGSSLVANASYTFRYLNPSSAVIRAQSVSSDGNGEAFDQYTFISTDARGNWTVELRNSSNTLVDSILVYVDPPPTNPSSIAPLTTGQASYSVTGDSLSISATFNNTSTGADYTGTTYRYLVRSPDLTLYLRSDGFFPSYTGTELTRSTSPHTVLASASATETITVNAVDFPSSGVYPIDVSWIGNCGFTIATATLYVPVGTTLASYQDSAHTIPRENFGIGATVYLAGTTYLPSTSYKVAYYDANGVLQLTHTVTSTSGGALGDSATTAALASSGTWHAVVYQATLSPPPVYNASDPLATSLDSFVVDLVAPTITVDALTTASTSPQLTGTVNDSTATVQVTVNGQTYSATNNGNGTWTLPAGTISPALAVGTYSVTAVATDPSGNSTTDSTSNELTIVNPAPVVSSPIVAGATSISGTSTSPVGTTITIYQNGVSIGTTTVLAGGAWTLTGVSGLVGGESITATAGTGAAMSAVSNTVVVTPSAPVVNGPLVAGGTSVTGTSTAPVGSTITVYVDGTPYTTTVLAGGTFTVTVPPLTAGASVDATVTANGQTSSPSNTVIVQNPAPVVSSPIVAGATSISGTSTSPVGTTITVYQNGVSIGTTTVLAGGAWTLTGVSGLVGGESITATAGTGAAMSAVSNTVVVTPSAPVVNGPLVAGGTSVTGTSTAPVGSTITVYVDGTPYTTTVLAGGTFTVTVPPLTAGASVDATVTANGQTSSPSNTVVVQNPAPVVSSPIVAGATSISGTSTSPVGTTITVYQNGVSIGTTTVLAGGAWTLTGVSGLIGGESITATAGTGAAMSAVSNTVVVTPSAPVVNGPLVAGGTSVTGTSTAPVGSTITVYVDGTPYTTTVLAGGTFTVTVPPLTAGASVDATVTANGQTSSPSNTVIVQNPAPVVSGPIVAGATSISGTSTSPVGTTITIYQNGVSIGTTTVLAGGAWTLTGVSGLVGGESITATAGTGAAMSAVSNTVVVTPSAPVVNGPLVAGGTSVTGTSTAPVGSTITVYVDGTPYTTTVLAGGTFTVTVPPLTAGASVDATVTAGGQTSAISNTVIVQDAREPAPVVAGPLFPDSTQISGTSTSPAGTTITVYDNGVAIGTTTVQIGGSWTLTGVSGLLSGEAITATAGTGANESIVSNTVVVQPRPPIVTTSLLAGATTLYGSSVEPAGSVITVYEWNGLSWASIGTATVQANGTWKLEGITPTIAGNQFLATVTSGGITSGNSNIAVVSASDLPTDLTPPPVVNGPIADGATTITGTSTSPTGSVIDVFVDGIYLGSTTVLANGTWSLTGAGVGPLVSGQLVSAVATEPLKGSSPMSYPVVVGGRVPLMRSDELTIIMDYGLLAPSIFSKRNPVYPSLDPFGANNLANWGEGNLPQPTAPDTTDGDWAYIRHIPSGFVEPDPTTLSDDGRPLVFYELLDDNANVLILSKSGTDIVFTYAP